MASAWITPRLTTKGAKRWRVEYRLGGRESPTHYGGSFKRKADATRRLRWVQGELAAVRVPDISVLREPERPPVFGDAAKAWLRSRIDVVDSTRRNNRSQIERVFRARPNLRRKRLDKVTHHDFIDVIGTLVAQGYKRGTIKLCRDAAAMVFDHYEITPNPVRHRNVKLPRERRVHIPPPIAEHVERVALIIPSHLVLPCLTCEATACRISALVTAEVGDFDEANRLIRVRWTVDKEEHYHQLHLPEDIFEVMILMLPPRAERDLAAPLFPRLTDSALGAAIRRACVRSGTPHFSPHGLRRRRASLHYHETKDLTAVAELLGDSKRVAKEHYIYAMTDYSEMDRTAALRRVREVLP